jgi:hypothetical protein
LLAPVAIDQTYCETCVSAIARCCRGA